MGIDLLGKDIMGVDILGKGILALLLHSIPAGWSLVSNANLKICHFECH